MSNQVVNFGFEKQLRLYLIRQLGRIFNTVQHQLLEYFRNILEAFESFRENYSLISIIRTDSLLLESCILSFLTLQRKC